MVLLIINACTKSSCACFLLPVLVLVEISIPITISTKQFSGPPEILAATSSTVIGAGFVSVPPHSHNCVEVLKVKPGGHKPSVTFLFFFVVKKWLMLDTDSSGCQSWNDIHAFTLGSYDIVHEQSSKYKLSSSCTSILGPSV